MVLAVTGFEQGTSGSALAAAGSGGGDDVALDTVTTAGAGSTATYDNAHAKRGTLAGKFVTAGAAGSTSFAAWTTTVGTQTTVYVRAYFWVSANPPAIAMIMRVLNGSNLAAGVNITTGGLLQIRDANNTAVATMTGAVPTGQWVRVEFKVVCSATAGTAELRLYNSADSTIATETISGTALNTNTQATAYRVGAATTGTAGSLTTWIDDFGVSTTDWLGPSSLTATASDTGTGSSTVALATSGSDTGTGASSTALALALADSGAGAEAAALATSSTDIGTGSEAPSVAVGSGDPGAGGEAGKIALATSDQGVGGDTTLNLALGQTDNATGTETITLATGQSDNGIGQDSGQLSVSAADAGTGDDETTDLALTMTDTAVGGESISIAAAASDPGTGDEQTLLAVSAVDLAVGAEAAALAVLATDLGAGVEFIGGLTLAVVDVGLGDESGRAHRPPRDITVTGSYPGARFAGAYAGPRFTGAATAPRFAGSAK